MKASNLFQSVIKRRNFSNRSQRTISTSANHCLDYYLEKDNIMLTRTSASDGRGPLSTALTRTKELVPSLRRVCLCSPTSHAGSFRCRLHRTSQNLWPQQARQHDINSTSRDEEIAFHTAIAGTGSPAKAFSPMYKIGETTIPKNQTSPLQGSRLSRVVNAEMLEAANLETG